MKSRRKVEASQAIEMLGMEKTLCEGRKDQRDRPVLGRFGLKPVSVGITSKTGPVSQLSVLEKTQCRIGPVPYANFCL